ncbi:MAG: hypothetical protein ACK55K_05145 [Bacteroidota bacterium]|jgi:hypothetical protein
MRSAVCTLYEGDFYLGVGALINSLVAHHFVGDIFVGYRGELPTWLKNPKTISLDGWNKVCYCDLLNGSKVFFLHLDTPMHFTNYKPQFLIELTTKTCKDYESIIYFDPDIVICKKWKYFEDWIHYGVAVVHDIITNDMPTTHPLRMKWSDIAVQCNKKIQHQISSYINAGFCGLKKEFWSFIHLWQFYVLYGELHYHSDTSKFMMKERPFPFRSLDQDSLNIAVMTFEGKISELGPEAMGFVHGVHAMAHAVGHKKPWNKSYIRAFLTGHPPSFADNYFWQYANGEIKQYNSSKLFLKKMLISFLNLLGRFYSK